MGNTLKLVPGPAPTRCLPRLEHGRPPLQHPKINLSRKLRLGDGLNARVEYAQALEVVERADLQPGEEYGLVAEQVGVRIIDGQSDEPVPGRALCPRGEQGVPADEAAGLVPGDVKPGRRSGSWPASEGGFSLTTRREALP